MLSTNGKVSVIFIYLLWTLIAIYGVYNVEIEFSYDFFLTDTDMSLYKFREVEK